MTGDITIRRARGEDAPVLTDLIYTSKQSNGYDDAFMAACADELRVTPDEIAESLFWVAEQRVPLGCVSLCINAAEREGHIETFFIAAAAKRKGIGRALWQTAYDSALAHSLIRLTLDADPAGVPFYEAMGFCTFRDVPSGSIPGRMLPQMELLIAPARQG